MTVIPAVAAVTDGKQGRLQELVDASELLVDMPSLANPAWLSAGKDQDPRWPQGLVGIYHALEKLWTRVSLWLSTERGESSVTGQGTMIQGTMPALSPIQASQSLFTAL
jgi:hypothetical protein